MRSFPKLIGLCCGLSAVLSAAQAPGDDQMFNFKADVYRSNFDTQETTAEGNVEVLFANKKIMADKVKMQSQSGRVEAEGNVTFQQGNLTLRGDAVKVDMKTGFGTFYNGRLVVEDGIVVEGKELARVDVDRYRVKNGKVSTCHDCPQSWSMAGSDLDIQIEGYAEIHHALFQVNDTPVAYFPVVYFPVKTKRQSGFLIPQFNSAPELGVGAYIPYFWAISDSSDATFQLNSMTKGGNRLLAEYRKLYSERTWVSGTGSFGHINQRQMEGVPYIRYGYSVGQRWQIAPRWVQRFQGELTSDGKYTSHYEKEFTRTRLPALENEASLAWQNYSLFGYSRVQFTKDNIPRDAGKFEPTSQVSRGDIHRLPGLGFFQPSFSLWGPVLSNSHVEYNNFWRQGPYDDPTTKWIRTGERSTFVSRLSSPRTFEYLRWEPSAEVRADYYLFNNSTNASNRAYRARYLLQQRVDMDFWKVYQTDSETIPAFKHSLIPFVNWSYSDNDKRSKHAFFEQLGSPRFDLFDPDGDVPAIQLGTISEEQKLRANHILTLGTTTRLIGRRGKINPSYDEFLGATVARDYNFRLEQFGRYRINAFTAWAGARFSTEYSFDPKSGDKDYRNDASYDHSRFFVGVFQTVSRVNREDKAETSGWNASIKRIGPFALTGMMVYEGLSDQINEQSYGIQFFSPSKCWVFGFGMSKTPGNTKWAQNFNFDITYRESVKKMSN